MTPKMIDREHCSRVLVFHAKRSTARAALTIVNGDLFVHNGAMADSDLKPERTARAIAHEEMQTRILQAARKQLTTVGPAQLSLRAIARDLGVVSSAIYRYVASRDELITRLILDSFTTLADTVAQACSQTKADPVVQLRTWAYTLRAWALDHPYDWALIYGVPIAGYAAPSDTIDPARRVNDPVLALYGQLEPNLQAGATFDVAEAALAPLRTMLEEHYASGPGTAGVATAMMWAWSSVHGFINLELGGHFHGSVTETEPVFEAIVDQLAHQLVGSIE